MVVTALCYRSTTWYWDSHFCSFCYQLGTNREQKCNISSLGKVLHLEL